jgi:hypothetical protein
MNSLKHLQQLVRKNMYVKFTEKNGMVSVKLNHVQRPNHVIPGFEITKQKRQLMLGVVSVSGGQSMKAENYQRNVIEAGTGFQCPKSDHMRINTETYEIAKNVRPYSGPNASYDWTEDFDGLQTFGNKCHIYYNFKSIVEAGGSQTRSLKCVYDFVKAQRDVIHKSRNVDKNTFFINILDGEICAKNMHMFRRFDNEDQIYVGDLYGYFDWLNSKLDTIL